MTSYLSFRAAGPYRRSADTTVGFRHGLGRYGQAAARRRDGAGCCCRVSLARIEVRFDISEPARGEPTMGLLPRPCVILLEEGHCQLNRTPLYSHSTAWHTCAMKAAPRVRSACFSSNGISIWRCHDPLHIDQPLHTPSVSGRNHQPWRLALLPLLPELPGCGRAAVRPRGPRDL
jgi:hypothetical protein